LKIFIFIAFIASQASAFVPCEINTPNDPGLKILVKSVFETNASTIMVQKAIGLPQTVAKGLPENVDVLKWCKCVYSKKVDKFGEEMAINMSSTKLSDNAKYDQWIKTLPAKKSSEHYVIVQGIEVECYNSSSK